MSTLISLLILVLIAGLIWYLVSLIPLPAPFAQIAQILVIIIMVLYMFSVLTGTVSMPTLRL